ncbi:MAG: hypothetical protein U1E53_09175 [Dongiaceae bacterium]
MVFGPGESGRLWYEIEGDVLPPPIELLDAVVPAFLFRAMRQGCALRVHGPVSTRLLANLEEFQAAWACWRPDLYRPVEILPDREVAAPPAADESAVVAFSGGLDSLFSTWRHRPGSPLPRHRALRAGILIHGFEIPLADAEGFRLAAARAGAALVSIGLPLVTIRTNWRELLCAEWTDEFGAALASCLHQLAGAAGAGIVGSDGTYHRLVLPWGSNPLTTRLLTGGAFEIVYDGAAFRRCEKAAAICAWPAALTSLRVCWEGPQPGSNCGRCEKCIRTQLNFLAVGQPVPPAFPVAASLRDIARLTVPAEAQLVGLRDVLAVARANGIAAPWTRALEIAIARSLAVRPFAPAAEALRRRLARLPWLRRLYRRMRPRAAARTIAASVTAPGQATPTAG